MNAMLLEIDAMTAAGAAILADGATNGSTIPDGAVEIVVAGTPFQAFADGSLWYAEERVLIVADLHFEKGSSFARRGQLLPPYDTAATLASLADVVFRLNPAVVVALGDSFHDNDGATRMGDFDRTALSTLQRGRGWIWIAGNHDDALPTELAGDHATAMMLGDVTLRHEPSEKPVHGEIAGHLHPAARVSGKSGSVRRRCFVASTDRMILPAFGALAGGLNVLAPVFAPLFPAGFTAHLLGASAVYSLPRGRLAGG